MRFQSEISALKFFRHCVKEVRDKVDSTTNDSSFCTCFTETGFSCEGLVTSVL